VCAFVIIGVFSVLFGFRVVSKFDSRLVLHLTNSEQYLLKKNYVM
jgi:hypothetical protein